ncbi:Clp protease N-terminal domain-containing protein [Micromonospora sp. DT47]|uniref:Clp protease N-terminal domain-containing protein n=1 Tax=Micromonospora sp. DT47 TaxID=3393431 RepID=UPI003CEDEDAA
MSLDAFRIPGGSLDDLISRFFGGDPFEGRPVERVDLSRLLSTESRQLLQRAAEQAAAWGSPYLNVEHLLWAAAQSDPTRRILDASGADPDDLARQIEAALPRGRPREDTPPLAPAAKRALLASAGPVPHRGLGRAGRPPSGSCGHVDFSDTAPIAFRMGDGMPGAVSAATSFGCSVGPVAVPALGRSAQYAASTPATAASTSSSSKTAANRHSKAIGAPGCDSSGSRTATAWQIKSSSDQRSAYGCQCAKSSQPSSAGSAEPAPVMPSSYEPSRVSTS